MIALISLLVVILFSIIVIRIGTVALEMTGLSRETAAFQAQSAFSGTGFTTSESEYVVSHPLRRKIIRLLIFIGNAGVASAIATLVLTFIGQSQKEATLRLIWLIVGLLLLYLFARSKLVDKGLRWIIKKGLEKFTSLRVYDYEQLLGLSKGYCIGEFKVKKGSWLENKKLKELKLDEEGIIVLAVYRMENGKEKFIGAPNGELLIKRNDLLVCYGPEEAIKQLSQRIKGRKGNIEHEKAVEEERRRREEEKAMIES